jgi:hypothetical protein
LKLDIITYSSGSTLCACERKYAWRYEQRVRPRVDDDEKLVVGSWSHVGLAEYITRGLDAALEAVNVLESETPAIGPDVFKVEQRAAQARAIVRVCAEKWPVPDAKSMTEHVVSMPVLNPDTQASSRTFTYRGVVDGVTGDVLLDWKTVSDIADFIRSRAIGYQTELYAAALAAGGVQVTTAHFRLIERPTIRLCNKDGGSSRVYEDRCVDWLRQPGKLAEHEMYVDPGRVEQARYWLWSVSKRILDNRRTGRWLRNEHACKLWGRDCEYLPLCTAEASGYQADDLIRGRYEVVDDPHPELSRQGDSGKA